MFFMPKIKEENKFDDKVSQKDRYDNFVEQPGCSTTDIIEEKPFICGACQTGFCKHSDFIDHCRSFHVTQTTRKSFLCGLCQKSFPSSTVIKRHFDIKHSPARTDPVDTCVNKDLSKRSTSEQDCNSINIKYHCDFCEREFYNETYFHNHRRAHIQENMDACTDNEPERKTVQEELFPCETCQTSLTSLQALKRHVNRMHVSKRGKCLTCELCQRNFSKLSYLKQHIRSAHTDERPYACDTCGKTFPFTADLNRHKLIHANTKHSCNVCNKVFASKAYLRKHYRNHTGQNPYVCTVCGKSFMAINILRIHIRSHSGEKPYKCKTCGKRFSCRSYVPIHERIHTGERPYTCDICRKGFMQKLDLQWHRQIHTVV